MIPVRQTHWTREKEISIIIHIYVVNKGGSTYIYIIVISYFSVGGKSSESDRPCGTRKTRSIFVSRGKEKGEKSSEKVIRLCLNSATTCQHL